MSVRLYKPQNHKTPESREGLYTVKMENFNRRKILNFFQIPQNLRMIIMASIVLSDVQWDAKIVNRNGGSRRYRWLVLNIKQSVVIV